jgi:glutamate/tyrosine decarboxylase-like PLP-dependent enzyme
MARIVEHSPEFEFCTGVQGLELADSITGDAHKLFNVPYDCGFFFSKHLDVAVSVFENSGAAYLSSGVSDQPIPSPLNVGIENSRRFRALPLYSALRSYGLAGYREMLYRQIKTARQIARMILNHPHYILLSPAEQSSTLNLTDLTPKQLDAVINKDIYMIVLFRARHEATNKQLVTLLNETGEIYVTGTMFLGEPAVRIAVANWQVEPESQTEAVRKVLDRALGA